MLCVGNGAQVSEVDKELSNSYCVSVSTFVLGQHFCLAASFAVVVVYLCM